MNLAKFSSPAKRFMSSGNKGYLLSLIILVILVNAVIAQRFWSEEIKPRGDDREYHETAKAIMKGSSIVHLADGDTDIGHNMAPGYSFLVAGVYKIFGPRPGAVFYMQILFQALVTLMLFYLLSQMSNRFVSYLFCLWLTAYHQIWKYNYLIMIEASTILLLVFVIVMFFKFLQTGTKIYLSLFSVLFGSLIFVNNRFIFHFAGLSLFLAFQAAKGKIIRWKQMVLVIVGVVLVLLPWHIRQYSTYSRLVFFSPKRTSAFIPDQFEKKITGVEIVPGEYSSQQVKTYNEYAEELGDRKNWSVERTEKTLSGFTQAKYNELVFKHNKVVSSLPRIIFSRLAEFWRIWQFDYSFAPGGDTRIVPPAKLSVNILNILFLLPMFMLFPAGIFYGLKQRNMMIQLMSLIILLHWFLHGIVHYTSRYRISVLPLIFFVAWYAGYCLFKDISGERANIEKGFGQNKNNHTPGLMI